MTRDDLVAFLVDELGADTDDFDDDTLLFSTSVLDSFSLVDLVAFLEAQGNFRMSPLDVSLDNLDSVNRILAYYRSHAR